MLIEIQDQENKLNELILGIENVDAFFDNGSNELSYSQYENIKDYCKQYAKWYAEEIIKHCAEVATTELTSTSIRINKQSILNVITEL